jgi:predicted MFS family arabinose efflux permease
MALPQLPIGIVSALLVLAVLAGSPFNAAQAAALPDILAGDRYTLAMALRSMTSQLAQLAGFAGGGLLIAALGPGPGLLIDGATFAASALIVRGALAGHPAGRRVSGREQVSYLAAARGAVRLIVQDKRLRAWLALAWLVGFYVIPEGIAAPLAASLHDGTAAVGVIMAAAPAGTALGAFLFIRLVSPGVRRNVVGLMAAATGLPMAAFILGPNTPTALGLLLISGIFTAYLIEAMSSFTRAVPSEVRGQVVGLASSGLLVVQGLGLLLAGLASEHIGPTRTIAVGGALGTALAIPLTISLSIAHKRERDRAETPVGGLDSTEN